MTATDKGWFAMAAIAAAAAGILMVAYIAQYGFDLFPCQLCYLQRVPYFMVVVFGGLALMPALDSRTRRVVLFHLVGLLVLEAGFAAYHAGVEWHWWAGPTTCTGPGAATTIAELTAALSKPPPPSCDKAAFVFAGLSMAGWNVIAALILAGAGLYAALRKDWWRLS